MTDVNPSTYFIMKHEVFVFDTTANRDKQEELTLQSPGNSDWILLN